MSDVDTKIDDGSYFAEAKEWYNEIFLRPAVMNAVMRFIAYVVIVMSVIATYNIQNNFPLNRKVMVMARLLDTAQYYPVIHKLQDADGIKVGVIRYLAEKYIKAREIYLPAFFARDYYFIQQSSQKEVFQEYYESLKQSDNTALELFKHGYSVEINPISSEYDAKKSQISITFEKKTISKGKKVGDNTKFKATMKFYMSQYDFNQSVTKELDFIVTSYKLEQVKNVK